MTLPIARRYDGEVLPFNEVALVSLVEVPAGLEMVVDAPFGGDPPPVGPPGPTDQLWEHEVVELFLAGPGSDAEVPYLEFEVGPWGHYLALLLRGVRRAERKLMITEVTVERLGARFTAQAILPRDWLPPRPWRVNATALRGVGSERSYLTHAPLPGPKPDFHQPASFVPWPLKAP